MKGRILFITLILLSTMKVGAVGFGRNVIHFDERRVSVPIVADRVCPTICIDGVNEWPGVVMAAENLAADFNAVTGFKCEVTKSGDTIPEGRQVIIGTIGRGGFIEQYLDKSDIENLQGAREKYIIKVFDGEPVIIAGSDKRGTTYGIYTISREIGVSPWHWWADVPAEHHEEIFATVGIFTENEPAVRYRGIFLNDEWPALTGFVNDTFGGYNHEFYIHVFDLLLRLKANFMWPAMWDAAFYDDDPLNSYYADMMGIIVGTSHHEPCARAQKEWHRYGSGKWDFNTNSKTLKNFWKEGIARAKDTEDIITIGMRGDGDEPMTEGQNIALLEKIVKAQRRIIKRETHHPVEQTPQVWALYKEVQDYYDKGMRVPDDVTLLLCDDNWGNVRRLPSKDEVFDGDGNVKRSGGYGMYYHFDYVGGPRNYRWISTNEAGRIQQQMELCWEHGVRELWIVNVGDLKPMEYPIQFFMDYAWNPAEFSANPNYTILSHAKSFVSDNLGLSESSDIRRAAMLIGRYGQLSRRRTPELLDADTYSFNYDEWPRVVGEWEELETDAVEFGELIDPQYRDAYEELVLFQIQAFANLHRMYYAAACGRQADVEKYYKRDRELMDHYNHEIAGGKWNHMMDQPHIGYRYWQMPDQDEMPVAKALSEPLPEKVVKPVHPEDDSKLSYICESDGYIAIDATSYYTYADPVWLFDHNAVSWYWFSGRDGSAASFRESENAKDAWLEYKVETVSSGNADITVLLSPTLDFNDGEGLTYGISVDDGPEQIVNYNGEYDMRQFEKWQAESINKTTTTHNFGEPGIHTVKFHFIDDGTVLQRILIDFGGMKDSYLGPPESPKRKSGESMIHFD